MLREVPPPAPELLRALSMSASDGRASVLRCPTPLPALYVGSDYAFCSIEKIKGSIWLKKF